MFIDHSSLVWHKSHQLRRFLRLKRQSEVPRYAEAHVLGPHSYLPKAGSPPRTGLHWFFSTSTPPTLPQARGFRQKTSTVGNRQCAAVPIRWSSWHLGLLVPVLSNCFPEMKEHPWSLRECLKNPGEEAWKGRARELAAVIPQLLAKLDPMRVHLRPFSSWPASASLSR